MNVNALIGVSVNLEIVKPTFSAEGAKMVVERIPFVAAGTSANVGRALTQNSIDTTVVALVGDNLESRLLVEKLTRELFLDVLELNVLSDVNLTVATESIEGTRYVCAKPRFINDKDIIDAAKASIKKEIVKNRRGLRVATGVKPSEYDFAHTLLYGERLSDQFLALNPSLQLIKESRDQFLELARGVDLLVINEVEAAAILETEIEMPLVQFKSLTSFANSVIVTMGSEGSCYFAKNGEKIFVPQFPSTETRSGGAGDCYLGFYLSAYAKTRNVETSMQFASCAASLKLSLGGGASAQPLPETVSIATREHYGVPIQTS